MTQMNADKNKTQHELFPFSHLRSLRNLRLKIRSFIPWSMACRNANGVSWGVGKMYQLFGDRMDALIAELNEVLVA